MANKSRKVRDLNLKPSSARWVSGLGGEEYSIAGKSFRGARLEDESLSHIDLRNADFAGAHLRAVDFRGSDLTDANFKGATIDRGIFDRAILNKAVFEGCTLINCIFSYADLANADFLGATLESVYLTSANLSGAYLVEAKIDEGTVIRGAYFAYAHVSPALFARIQDDQARELSSIIVDRAPTRTYAQFDVGDVQHFSTYMPDGEVPGEESAAPPRMPGRFENPRRAGRTSNPVDRSFAAKAGNEILDDMYTYELVVHCAQLAERDLVAAAADEGRYGAVDAEELLERSIPILKRALSRKGYDSALTHDGSFSPAGIRYALYQVIKGNAY
jgi:uncharacterized protein YjbI with pentapeptide repeats